MHVLFVIQSVDTSEVESTVVEKVTGETVSVEHHLITDDIIDNSSLLYVPVLNSFTNNTEPSDVQRLNPAVPDITLTVHDGIADVPQVTAAIPQATAAVLQVSAAISQVTAAVQVTTAVPQVSLHSVQCSTTDEETFPSSSSSTSMTTTSTTAEGINSLSFQSYPGLGRELPWVRPIVTPG